MPKVSIHAISGTRGPQTMKVHGKIGQKQMLRLVDSESTHNFMHHKMATRMRLKPRTQGKLEVAVANGDKLLSAGHCKGIAMNIQGCDAVLGAQWLRTLGPILWDFSTHLKGGSCRPRVKEQRPSHLGVKRANKYGPATHEKIL
ncbi:hypothetical protein QQP08_020034 [Theobroma cacao]|nr:hypothetical protein QQP08_020026 [Theobroma cacao]WRX27547.1 hypothetical protein QQP08_020034 [Theobroma cacao]